MAATYFQMAKQNNAHINRGEDIKQIWPNAYLGVRSTGIPILSTFLFV